LHHDEPIYLTPTLPFLSFFDALENSEPTTFFDWLTAQACELLKCDWIKKTLFSTHKVMVEVNKQVQVAPPHAQNLGIAQKLSIVPSVVLSS